MISKEQTEIRQKVDLLRKSINNDPIKLIESIFRVRSASGQLLDYKFAEPHKEIIREGILGDKSVQFRVIDKGRQAGFSTLDSIESLTVSQYFPLTYQYYIATKEKQAKNWLKKTERIARDARLNFDGSRIIDIDTRASNELQKVIRHGKLEESYICGLAASPGGVRGETCIKLTLDEFAWMIWRKDLQKQVYESVKYFIATGGFMTVQSTPAVQTDIFWDMYSNPKEYMMKAYYCPVITNHEQLDLNKDLREQELVIPYWWINVDLLEKSRRDDVDFFKQEVLGLPVDASHRYITPELVYQNVMSEEEEDKLKNKTHICKMAIDIAQVRDLTAITIGTKIGDTVHELYITDSSDDYIEQFELIKSLMFKYQPNEIGIDNTGIGRAIGDMIKTQLPVKLTRFEFASRIEVSDTFDKRKMVKVPFPAYIATEFKKSLIDSTYKMLDNRVAISHILRVEKTATDTGVIRFSGKATGRDDHFISKSMLNAMFIGKMGVVPGGFSAKAPTPAIPVGVSNRLVGRRLPVDVGASFSGKYLHW